MKPGLTLPGGFMLATDTRLAKLMMPRQLGPRMRMPLARAISASAPAVWRESIRVSARSKRATVGFHSRA